MNQLRHTLTVIVSLATIACGPPRIGSDPDAGQNGTDTTGVDTTGAETTRSETTSTETSTSMTATFVIRPDVSEIVECDSFEQDCPEGEKCVPYGSTGGNWDANKCVPVMGDQEPGEPCWWGGVVEATDNCDETSACWDVWDVDGELVRFVLVPPTNPNVRQNPAA